jgi:PAS domain S-box-containing protein
MLARLGPLLIVGALVAATAGVWRLQVQHQHRMLARHTEDVCVQAARRLQTFVGAQLSMGGVLGEDWTRHGGSGSALARFDSLSSLVLAEFRSFHAVALLEPNGRPPHVVAEPDSSMAEFLRERGQGFLRPAQFGGPVISDPYEVRPGDVSFFAAWTLAEAPLGATHVVVEYRVNELIDDCFHGQIKAEFSYWLEDEGESLFRFAVADPEGPLARTKVQSVQVFPVHNRQWRLTVTPRPETTEEQQWRVDLWVPALGLGLSLGVGLLLRLSQVRMERYRVSEARYRGVFDSATDGLMVLGLDGTILDANPAAGTILGREPGHLLGLHLDELVATDPPSRLGQLAGELERLPAARLDTVAAPRDGSSRDLELRASRFVHHGGPAALVVVSDVTERRVATRRQELLSRRALMAQEEERARVARELHDDLGQLLTGLRLELDYLRRGHAGIASAFATATEIVDTAVETVRRICRGLRPPLLDDLGLEASVRQLVSEFEARAACRVSLDLAVDEEHGPLPTEVSLCAYRVTQEALTNVSRHARASRVSVEVLRDDCDLVVTVTDDGRGFEMEHLPASSGLGLTGMQERAALVNGHLAIRSNLQGGTSVVLRVPLAAAERVEAS